MKAVVGVGFTTHCLAGVAAFVRLDFPGSHAVLVHCVESVLPDGGFMPPDSLGPIADIQRQRRVDGEQKLAEVASDLQACGVESRSEIVYGRPAHEITSLAEREAADMIVTGSAKKGALDSFLMGSVTRALVVDAKRSILVGKQPLHEGTKINAVLATDHSDYADKCVDHLIELQPRGIGKLTIVSADTTDAMVQAASMLESGTEASYADTLNAKNEALCERLRPLCASVESIVLTGKANDAINATMEQSKADLLIIGAHGHGFLERLLIGSTAMHMVGNSPWNTLVLRV